MPNSTLTDFDDSHVEEATEDPTQDVTLEDLGEDKELNTPPEDSPDQDEPEAGNQAEAAPEPAPEPAKETDKEPEAKPTADQAAPKTDAEKTTEDILKYAGLDSTLKIKGKEYKLSDFGKEDLLAFIQKGARMTQVGQELSKREQALAERERVAEANVAEATKVLQQYRSATPPAPPSTEPPEELKPSEYDTEDIKAAKAAGLAVWKQSQELTQRLNQIEGGLKSQQTEAESQKFMDELNAHKADFPLASVEEVIAVHALRPDIPLSDLVRRSHAIYGSEAHVEEVFKNCPEVRKHYEDKHVAAYLARQRGTKVINEKPSSGGSRSIPASTAKIRSMDDAGLAAKKMLARLQVEAEADND